jgi:polar amino acid transport system substrate-binding protein
MLSAGKLEAFATNKATLFEMSDELQGSRVLDGRWGLETFAIGIPKGRDAAMPLVSEFVGEAKANGTVTRAVARAGLRGTREAQANK